MMALLNNVSAQFFDRTGRLKKMFLPNCVMDADWFKSVVSRVRVLIGYFNLLNCAMITSVVTYFRDFQESQNLRPAKKRFREN